MVENPLCVAGGRERIGHVTRLAKKGYRDQGKVSIFALRAPARKRTKNDRWTMVVAIDGPAGVGKSTVARKCAETAGFLYINSGSFYRAITLAVLSQGCPPEDPAAVLAAARACTLDIRDGRLLLDGRDVEDRLHSDEIDSWVAAHSAIPEVRQIVNRRLRQIATERNVVVEGRDIGTVVFPGAELKVFLDADVSTRAGRRHEQGTSSLTLSEIQKTIQERDLVDRNKATGRLVPAADALRIDTSLLTIDQVCERVAGAILVSRNNPGDTRRL
jgi:cytidylate kinase